MKFLKILLVLALLAAGLYFFHSHVIGISLQPLLEKQLSEAFAMPVAIKGLRVHPWPDQITIEKIVCLNPKEFRRQEHFSGEDIRLQLDLKELRQKCIRIQKAYFKKVVFAVETQMTPQGPHSNTWVWYHNMGLDEDDPPHMLFPKNDAISIDEAAAKMAAQGEWRVKIDRLDLDNGTFIYDYYDQDDERHIIFQNLKGYWTGFDFVSEYTSKEFREFIKLDGTFGLNPPARFSGEGKCQFADGDNFDVQVQAIGGSIAEYKFFLFNLPGEVKGGTFDLVSHLRCFESNLESRNRLTLRSMKLASPTATQKILKYPFSAVLKMLETEQAIELEVDVNGYIGDPKFHVFSAFSKAFQKSLAYKAKATVVGITKGTTKITTQAPGQVKDGLGKIGTLLNDTLNDTFNIIPLPSLPSENGTSDDANQPTRSN